MTTVIQSHCVRTTLLDDVTPCNRADKDNIKNTDI